MRKLLIILIVLLLMIIGVLSFFLYERYSNEQKYTSETQEVFVIESGQSKKTILNNLKDAKLIDSVLLTQYDLKVNKISIYAGEFGLTQAMTDQEVLSVITQPTSNISNGFLITEGATIDTIASNLAEYTDVNDSDQEFIEYWSDPNTLNKLISEYDFITTEVLNEDLLFPLEGYFFPATYELPKDASPSEATKVFLDKMNTELQKLNLSNSQYTVHQLLTLASVVERETLHVNDKPIVAEVFYNRLDADMPLQSDITVLYAKQEHKEEVLYSDLEFESPFNTYLNKGLPPGPISTVSITSLEATINPDSNDYIYFFADQNTGEIYYSKTIEEHEKISEKYAWEFEN
ncbi:endolytic transglycosylase MltG [Mollicutes bacterium LVI A0039]|nr:endolytic transglycosylase MltG [Mollicutes bacterium LVI A0039]